MFNFAINFILQKSSIIILQYIKTLAWVIKKSLIGAIFYNVTNIAPLVSRRYLLNSLCLLEFVQIFLILQ